MLCCSLSWSCTMTLHFPVGCAVWFSPHNCVKHLQKVEACRFLAWEGCCGQLLNNILLGVQGDKKGAWLHRDWNRVTKGPQGEAAHVQPLQTNLHSENPSERKSRRLNKLYVSPTYGGKASDTFIPKQSRLLGRCIAHVDSVMVDKGFLINELHREKKGMDDQASLCHGKTAFSRGSQR